MTKASMRALIREADVKIGDKLWLFEGPISRELQF